MPDHSRPIRQSEVAVAIKERCADISVFSRSFDAAIGPSGVLLDNQTDLFHSAVALDPGVVPRSVVQPSLHRPSETRAVPPSP